MTPQEITKKGGTADGVITIENVENRLGWTISEVIYNAFLEEVSYDVKYGYTDEEWADKMTDNGQDVEVNPEKYWPIKLYDGYSYEEMWEGECTNNGTTISLDNYKMKYKMMGILLNGDYDMDGSAQISFQSNELKKYNKDDILILSINNETGEMLYLELDDFNKDTRRMYSYI